MLKAIRPIRIDGDVAYVPLTKGYEAVIDAADANLVRHWNWFADDSTGGAYAMRNGRPDSAGKRRHIRLHRVLLGDPEGREIDHIDGDTLNNRRSNLRAVTSMQNRQNAKVRKDNPIGLKGAHRAPSPGKWKSEIQSNGQRRYLGTFCSPEDAHAAYCAASRELHGQFGRTD